MDEKKMKGSIITNLDQAFAGRVAGVTSMATSGAPGSSTSIRVRGQATINAGAEPLYVIDGVIWNNSNSSGASVGLGDRLGNGSVSSVSPLSTINPADIVSMEILKDASATAIYGAQGANGVVLITTKHGKTGEAKFSYDGMVAWQHQGKRIDMLNLREFAEFYNDMVAQGGATADATLSDPSVLGKGTNWQDALVETRFERHLLAHLGKAAEGRPGRGCHHIRADHASLSAHLRHRGWLHLCVTRRYEQPQPCRLGSDERLPL